MSTLKDRMAEASVRVDRLVWLPAAVIDGVMSDTLKEAIDDLYADEKNQVITKIPQLKEIFVSGDLDDDWLADVLAPVDGYLAELARPVPSTFYGDAGSYSSSWGHYSTQWVHVSNMGELTALAEIFSQEVVSRAYAKHLAKIAEGVSA